MKKIGLEIAGVVLAILLIFGLFWLIFPPASSRFDAKQKVSFQLFEKQMNYAALGDSLTEGVGDATGQGGFVPLFAKDLENDKNVKVNSSNFGKAGDTSTQIYDRMQQQSKIMTGLKKADIITLTVGGNDVMKVIRDNISQISTLDATAFEQPAKAYQKHLRQILAAIRKVNNHAPIYVLGIYNPFYLNFPQITTMQTVINNWNTATDSVVKSEKKAYFVPINDLIYKGVDGKKGVADDQTTGGEDNDLLYTGDHFHPNNVGYQIMAQAVYQAYLSEENK